MTLDQAQATARPCGQNFDALKEQAATREFKPVPLGTTASVGSEQVAHHRFAERRREARGSESLLKNEYVVYTAHWDHLGRGEAVEGDDLSMARSTTAGHGCADRDWTCLQSLATPTEAFDSVSGRHRGGTRAARIGVLLSHPALTRREDAGRDQHGWPQRLTAARKTSRLSGSAIPIWTITRAMPPRHRAGSCVPMPSRRKASITDPTIQFRQAGSALP